jgi:hypothetical protein
MNTVQDGITIAWAYVLFFFRLVAFGWSSLPHPLAVFIETAAILAVVIVGYVRASRRYHDPLVCGNPLCGHDDDGISHCDFAPMVEAEPERIVDRQVVTSIDPRTGEQRTIEQQFGGYTKSRGSRDERLGLVRWFSQRKVRRAVIFLASVFPPFATIFSLWHHATLAHRTCACDELHHEKCVWHARHWDLPEDYVGMNFLYRPRDGSPGWFYSEDEANPGWVKGERRRTLAT